MHAMSAYCGILRWQSTRYWEYDKVHGTASGDLFQPDESVALLDYRGVSPADESTSPEVELNPILMSLVLVSFKIM